jgi:uncharacterized Tic20 family protein
MNDTAAGPANGPTAGPPSGPPPQVGPPPSGWQQASPPSGPVGAAPLDARSERNWAMAAHLSSFLAAWVALGFLGPLVVMLLVGNRSPFVRRHAVEALNFNLSWLLYIVVAGVLAWILIGIPMLVALGLAYLVLVLYGAIEASAGREFRYPLTIRVLS